MEMDLCSDDLESVREDLASSLDRYKMSESLLGHAFDMVDDKIKEREEAIRLRNTAIAKALASNDKRAILEPCMANVTERTRTTGKQPQIVPRPPGLSSPRCND